jgi:glucose-6-phosphate 1-dehydrogenase
MQNKVTMPAVFVIFGGTGDLTNRKLMPSIYNLYRKDLLPDKFALVSVGRREYSMDEYRNEIKGSIEKFSRTSIDENTWERMKSRLFYVSLNFEDDDGYFRLREFLDETDRTYHTAGNRIYYLAVSPQYFEIIANKLESHNMALGCCGIKRIVIEKPFGKDLASAEYLNNTLTRVFKEENIYRIDHYLGKEMIQNIMVLRFSNPVFEQLWNNKYIDNIQISSNEIVGVENRGGYYETSGALKDMMQNHMFQLLALTAMEPPVNLDTGSVRDEKLKVLRSLIPIDEDFVRNNIVRGQYGIGHTESGDFKAYRQEAKVSPESDVETFAAMKIFIENFRWAGVPFFIRTGKRLKNKDTEIVIQFKELPKILYNKGTDLLPNLLLIKVQPKEGVMFQFNGKKPGIGNDIIPVVMDFSQNSPAENNSPESYERLLSDVIKGDATLFATWNEVDYSWRYVDKITEIWEREKPDFPNYEAGSWGPEASYKLLAENGRKWWNL